jgi:site-specific DNA recombinase
MVCDSCGATIAQVSGKGGGYYGCLAATKGACDNKTLIRRTLAEKVIIGAVQEQIADPEHIAYILQRVEQEIAKLRSDLPDTLKLKEAELTAEQRRLANFVDFIGEGRGSQTLAKAWSRPSAASTSWQMRWKRSAATETRSSARLPSSGSRTA